MLNRINLEVAKIVDKNSGDANIGGLFITDKKVVATDRYRLLEVSTIANRTMGEVLGRKPMLGHKPFIANADYLKKIKPAKDSVVAVSFLNDTKAEFIYPDNAEGQIQAVPRVNGEFPDYEKIVPTGKPVVEFNVNPKYLRELLDILGDINETIQVEFYGDTKPLILKAKNSNQSGRALLMLIKD